MHVPHTLTNRVPITSVAVQNTLSHTSTNEHTTAKKDKQDEYKEDEYNQAADTLLTTTSLTINNYLFLSMLLIMKVRLEDSRRNLHNLLHQLKLRTKRRANRFVTPNFTLLTRLFRDVALVLHNFHNTLDHNNLIINLNLRYNSLLLSHIRALTTIRQNVGLNNH